MKKIIIFVTLSIVSAMLLPAQAQKFGYIDSEFITSKMPDYKKAQDEMEKFSDKWLKDVQDKYTELEKLRLQFQQEEILLTPDMKRERQKAIDDKESAVKDMQNKVFGMSGLMFQKKKELMKPIMDDINKACEKVARQKQLMFIFDKAGDISMIYTDPRHDYTDYVIEALGITEDKKEDKKENNQVTKPK